MRSRVLGAAIALLLSSAAFGNTIAEWTFETSQPIGTGSNAGAYAAEVGSGSASEHHSNTTTAYSDPAGAGSLYSFSSTKWAVADYYQFQVSTLGIYKDLDFSFFQTSSGTGPKNFQISYSTDGTHYTTLGAVYNVLGNGTSPNSSWSTGMTMTQAAPYKFDFDLSTLGLYNKAAVYLRLTDMSTTSAAGGTVATGGTDRVDNVIVTGAVPLPAASTGGAVLLGVMALVKRQRAAKA